MKTKSITPVTQKLIFATLCLILLLTGFIYRSSLNGEFLSYDDTDNVVNNPVVRNLSLSSIPQFFQTGKLYMYTPLTFLSYAVDLKIWGMDPFGFRLSNLLLHLLNAILVFIFARQFLKKTIVAFFIALLFAFHPANVDTVAWISARSNLLAGLFILLSLICYFQYAEKLKLTYLLLSIVAYLLSLLAKSSGILLPFFLFVIDYLVKRKWSIRIIIEKVPFFIFGLLMGLITIFFRTDTGSPQSIATFSMVDRFFMITYSLCGYLFKTIIPINLSEIYAFPLKPNGILPLLYYLSPMIFLAIIAILKFMRRSGFLPIQILLGFLMFLILILPTQVVLLEDGFMAGRYGYIPVIGIFLVLGVILNGVLNRISGKKIWLLSLLIIPLIVFAINSYSRSLVWKTTLSLFDDAISHCPDAAFSHNCRGMAKYNTRDFEGAMSDYNTAIQLNPAYSGCYYNRGIVFFNNQQFQEALKDYNNAILLNPKFASCYDARGILYMDGLRNDSLAMEDYNNAININPEFAQAYYNRGILEMRSQKPEAACEDFRKVRQLGFTQADELINKYCP